MTGNWVTEQKASLRFPVPLSLASSSSFIASEYTLSQAMNYSRLSTFQPRCTFYTFFKMKQSRILSLQPQHYSLTHRLLVINMKYNSFKRHPHRIASLLVEFLFCLIWNRNFSSFSPVLNAYKPSCCSARCRLISFAP